MPTGFQMPSGGFVSVPEGQPRIAQRFNVGSPRQTRISPGGRSESSGHFGRPFGTCSLIAAPPNAEALGYFQSSLRDNALLIQLASGETPGMAGGTPAPLPEQS